MGIMDIVVLVYLAWAFYSGWKLLSGRFEFLDRKTFLSATLKILLCMIVGFFYGAIYLLILIFKLVFRN